MTQYRLICLYCGATIITACPEEVMWELCPGCRSHRLDDDDLMMAEVTREERTTDRTTGMMAC